MLRPTIRSTLLCCLLATTTLVVATAPSVLAFQTVQVAPTRKAAPTLHRMALHSVKVGSQQDAVVQGSQRNGVKTVDSKALQAPRQQQQARINSFSSVVSLSGKKTSVGTIEAAKTLMNVERGMSSSTSSSKTTTTEIDQNDKVVMLGLLWITACLSALDRVAMSVALVPMTIEFGLTDTIKGSISSFFSVGYGLGIIPAGILLSFASPRLVMSAAIISWSLATLATPLAAESLAVSTTAGTLLFVRACVGAAESLVMPTLQRLLLAWTTAEEKAVGIATVVSGFQAGTIAAYLVSPLVMDAFGDGDAWRQLFYVYGAFGMALMVPWLLVAKDGPEQGSSIGATPVLPEQQQDASSSPPRASLESAIQVFKDAPWSDFIRSKGAWAMLLAHCSKNWYVHVLSCLFFALVDSTLDSLNTRAQPAIFIHSGDCTTRWHGHPHSTLNNMALVYEIPLGCPCYQV